MKTEQVIWAGGINRSLDPRHIQNHEQYDAYNLEVVERGALCKRKGFGRWRTDGNSVIPSVDLPGDVVRGIAVMYDRDGNRYLFVLYNAGETYGTKLWVEKNGSYIGVISFFPSGGTSGGPKVRWAVFGDRIYFVNGVDWPRWYKEYDGENHIWGIGGVPSPARRAEDESTFDYFVSRALYADCITTSEDLGIDPPGIWRYKQTIGYYGKEADEQVEESNAGPASKMFHCQFNTAEALGTQLQGYIEKGIPLGIADFDDLILDANETGGQDYGDEIRWMRMYRQWKMFSDELYSPFEFLVELKKGWPTSISDVYGRDSAMVAPTTRVSIPVSHHIENANNRLFLGRVEKELFPQPGLPEDFRGLSGYKPDFPYRWPVTIQNTNPKTLTGAVIALRLQKSDDTKHTATPPSGGGTWTGAYIDWNVNFEQNIDKVMFVGEDGVTPLGFAKIVDVGADSFTFLVEIPEIAAGGSRTIYFYAGDDVLGGYDPLEGEPGHWKSVMHYPLCASDHWLLTDIENWEATLSWVEVNQKRSNMNWAIPPGWAFPVGISRQTISDVFFNKSAMAFSGSPIVRVLTQDATERGGGIRFRAPSDLSSVFTVAFLGRSYVGSDDGDSYVEVVRTSDGAVCVGFRFYRSGGTAYCVGSVYYESGTSKSLTLSTALGSGGISCNGDWLYYAITVDGEEMILCAVYGDQGGHAGEGSSWDDTTHYNKYSTSRADIGQSIRMSTGNMWMAARVTGVGGNGYSTYVDFKELQIMGRVLGGADELLHMLNRDTYFPNFGLATVGDRKSQTGEKHPDRMYFSKLNQPNSFEAIDFRDMGELGRPIQGIKGIHNRLFVFDENKIRALFSAGAEQTLTLEAGDTTMWNLSQDLTGRIGGLGVLAPDTLVTMEFAGRDGVGFLSRRGFYFFDGQSFVHISEKVDNLIRYHIDTYGKDFSVLFIKKKRQLLITPTDVDRPSARLQVANMKFATDVDSIVWTEFGMRMKYGVELDEYIDDGDFVFITPYITAQIPAQILKLDGNTGNSTYVDIRDDGVGGESSDDVACSAWSKHFYLFDSEMIKCDLYITRNSGLASGTTLVLYADPTNIPGTPPVPTVTINNPNVGINQFPVGTHGMVFMFKITDDSASDLILEQLNFYFNKHGHRRL